MSLSDTATATITAWNTTDDTTYTATITLTTSGKIVIGVPADVARDSVNNSNTASSSHTITVNILGGVAPAALSRVMNPLDTIALESLDQDLLEAQLQILLVESDGSLKYLQAIALLENTLAAMRPDKTHLLANFLTCSIRRRGYRIIWRATLMWISRSTTSTACKCVNRI